MEEPGRPRQYALGLATGFYAPAGADPEHDITGWRTRLEAGEPYDSDPALRQIIDQVTRFHSAYYIDDSEEPAPLFIYNAFTDDLFPAAEPLRFWLKTRAATTMADFGTPSTTSSYTLCVYDGSAALVMKATAPAGGTCAGRPSWGTRPNGFRYDDRLTPTGTSSLDLQAGDAGAARIKMGGKGDHLTMSSLPVQSLPVTVQLLDSDGTCWGSSFSSAQQNDTGRLKALSD